MRARVRPYRPGHLRLHHYPGLSVLRRAGWWRCPTSSVISCSHRWSSRSRASILTRRSSITNRAALPGVVLPVRAALVVYVANASDLVVRPKKSLPPGKHCQPKSEKRTTPPMRGSRRSRAVCAKADAVGGGLLCGMSPHRFGFGFTPSPHRLPLKGGVDLKFSLVMRVLRRGRSRTAPTPLALSRLKGNPPYPP